MGPKSKAMKQIIIRPDRTLNDRRQGDLLPVQGSHVEAFKSERLGSRLAPGYPCGDGAPGQMRAAPQLAVARDRRRNMWLRMPLRVASARVAMKQTRQKTQALHHGHLRLLCLMKSRNQPIPRSKNFQLTHL